MKKSDRSKLHPKLWQIKEEKCVAKTPIPVVQELPNNTEQKEEKNDSNMNDFESEFKAPRRLVSLRNATVRETLMNTIADVRLILKWAIAREMASDVDAFKLLLKCSESIENCHLIISYENIKTDGQGRAKTVKNWQKDKRDNRIRADYFSKRYDLVTELEEKEINEKQQNTFIKGLNSFLRDLMSNKVHQIKLIDIIYKQMTPHKNEKKNKNKSWLAQRDGILQLKEYICGKFKFPDMKTLDNEIFCNWFVTQLNDKDSKYIKWLDCGLCIAFYHSNRIQNYEFLRLFKVNGFGRENKRFKINDKNEMSANKSANGTYTRTSDRLFGISFTTETDNKTIKISNFYNGQMIRNNNIRFVDSSLNCLFNIIRESKDDY